MEVGPAGRDHGVERRVGEDPLRPDFTVGYVPPGNPHVTHQIGQVGPEFEAVEADPAGAGIKMSLRLGQGAIPLTRVSEKYRTRRDLVL